MKASFTAVFTWVMAQELLLGAGFRVPSRGISNSVSVVIREEENKYTEGLIAATWSCTKSFWFLKPVDNYYPLGASREPRS